MNPAPVFLRAPVRMRFRILTLLLLAAGAARAQPAPGPAVEIRTEVSADSVQVGERFEVVLTVLRDSAYALAVPAPAAPPAPGLPPPAPVRAGDVDLLALLDSATSRVGDRVEGRFAYEAAAFGVDSALLAPIPVGLVRGGDTLLVTGDSVFVPIVSVVPPEASDIQGLAPLVEFGYGLLFWVLLLLGALALAALLWYYLRRRSGLSPEEAIEAPPPAPYEAALERLHALEAFDLAGAPDVKPFYVELTDAARAYLGARLGVHALELTSRELMQALQRWDAGGPVPPTALDHLRPAFATADLAKFADVRPPPEEGARALSSTRAALEAIEEDRRRREEEARRAAEAQLQPEPSPTA